MLARLENIEVVAKNIKTFWFRPKGPFNYVAGQFVEVKLHHDNPDERGTKRWFTLSSSPTEPLIGITTKLTAELKSSYKQAIEKLKLGNEVAISEPMGDFVLPKDISKRLVFTAGGIGITTYRSMVKYLIDTGDKRNVTLIYALNAIEDAAFLNLFRAYGIEPKLVLLSPPASWRAQSGLLSADKLLGLSPDTGNELYYISGPEPMAESIAKGLASRNIPERRVITDYFSGYSKI